MSKLREYGYNPDETWYQTKDTKEALEKAKERGYENPEIASIEDAMIDVVKSLKPHIDNESYDTLISDEVGGRIPTLILRKIMKKRHPDIDITTHFIPGGFALPDRNTYGKPSPDFNSETDQLKKIALLEEFKKIKSDKKVLVVTQKVFKGETMRLFNENLEVAGITPDNIDWAVLSGAEDLDAKENIHTGKHSIGIFAEQHDPVSGVAKKQIADGSIELIRLTEKLGEAGLAQLSDYKKNQRFYNHMGTVDWRGDYVYPEEKNESRKKTEQRISNWNKKMKRPLTKEQQMEYQKRIVSARRDIEKMSENIINSVWGIDSASE